MNNSEALPVLLDYTKPSRSIRRVWWFINPRINLPLYYLTHLFIFCQRNPKQFLDPRNVCYGVVWPTLETGIKPTVPLSAIDKENSLESSLYWFCLLIHSLVGLCAIVLRARPNYCDVMWRDLWRDQVWQSVTSCHMVWHNLPTLFIDIT